MVGPQAIWNIAAALTTAKGKSIIRAGADKMTSIPGVYAAGDIARAPHSISSAVADGVTAGMSVHQALVFG